MGGKTGNLRTQRNQSGTNGQRTLGSILASDAGNGAGSIARMAKWYAIRGPANGTQGFYNSVIGLNKGRFSSFGLNKGMNTNYVGYPKSMPGCEPFQGKPFCN